MTKTWLVGVSLFAAASAMAAPVGGFDPARLSKHVQILGSDAFEGRGPATPAETKTVDYIIDQFRAAGLQPGGDIVDGKRQWTQAVPLLKSEIVGTADISLNENGTVVPLRQGPDVAVLAPLNGSKAVNIANAPLVFVGYGVTAPERNWDDFKGVDVHGKILVVLINDPDFEGGEGDFAGKAMTYYGRWTYKFEEAAKRGAAGIIIVHETAPASYPWNVVQNSNTNAQFDIVRQDPAARHSGLESWIQRPLAVQLFERSGLNFEQAKAAAKRRDFQPIPLKATLSAQYGAETQVITSHNVVGLLPGSRYPDETLIYSAHWDHLGIGKPDATGDRIYNGAVDNATGVSQIIEQARAFTHGPRPQRSVVFLAVTAEEKGLLGSEYYATHPLYPLGKTVGVLNTDAMNVFGPTRNFSISGSAKLGLLDDLIAEGKREGRSYAQDPHPEAGSFFRSDHFSFAKVGVPAVSFDSGDDMVDGGVARGEALLADYTAHHYHQPSDEWSAQWQFTGLARDAAMLHAVGERLANSREWPNWSEDSEFRAARDASAAERDAAAPKKGERG